jgi:transposase
MLLDRGGIRIFVFKDEIDMRAGFERLHGFCVSHMNAKMNDGHAFVFFGKNRTRMKVLVYDGSGLVLIAKRIEQKRFMCLKDLLGRSEISMEELKLIFHGSVIRGPVFGEDADIRDEQSEKESSVTQNFISTQRERVALPLGAMNSSI